MTDGQVDAVFCPVCGDVIPVYPGFEHGHDAIVYAVCVDPACPVSSIRIQWRTT
jgi:hypothetical protein